MTRQECRDLLKEVETTKDLDHPNIIKYYESYEDPQSIYLVMELCEGGEIHSDQRTEALWSAEMRKLLKALNHCHKQDIMHRDIKPANIMYGADNEVKLIDFGFACKANNRRGT